MAVTQHVYHQSCHLSCEKMLHSVPLQVVQQNTVKAHALQRHLGAGITSYAVAVELRGGTGPPSEASPARAG